MQDRICRERVERFGRVLFVDKFVDDSGELPWENDCGCGPVSECTQRKKEPGERVLCDDNRSGLRGTTYRRYYDFKKAVEIAKRDGWDAPPYGVGTRGQRAVRAVEENFERLRRWCNDDWGYIGVAVTLAPEDYDEDDGCVKTDFLHALWGIESDCHDYIKEVVEELVSEFDLDRTHEEVAAFMPHDPPMLSRAAILPDELFGCSPIFPPMIADGYDGFPFID